MSSVINDPKQIWIPGSIPFAIDCIIHFSLLSNKGLIKELVALGTVSVEETLEKPLITKNTLSKPATGLGSIDCRFNCGKKIAQLRTLKTIFLRIRGLPWVLP